MVMTAMRPRTNSRGDRSTPLGEGGNGGNGGGMRRLMGAYSMIGSGRQRSL